MYRETSYEIEELVASWRQKGEPPSDWCIVCECNNCHSLIYVPQWDEYESPSSCRLASLRVRIQCSNCGALTKEFIVRCIRCRDHSTVKIKDMLSWRSCSACGYFWIPFKRFHLRLPTNLCLLGRDYDNSPPVVLLRDIDNNDIINDCLRWHECRKHLPKPTFPPSLHITLIVEGYTGNRDSNQFPVSCIPNEPLISSIQVWEDTFDLKLLSNEVVELEQSEKEEEDGSNSMSCIVKGTSSYQFCLLDVSPNHKPLEIKKTPTELELKEGDVLKAIRRVCREQEGGNSGTPHALVLSSFETPVNCIICGLYIWGVLLDGRKCAKCHIAVHHHCVQWLYKSHYHQTSTPHLMVCDIIDCDVARREVAGVIDYSDFMRTRKIPGLAESERLCICKGMAIPVQLKCDFYAMMKEIAPDEVLWMNNTIRTLILHPIVANAPLNDFSINCLRIQWLSVAGGTFTSAISTSREAPLRPINKSKAALFIDSLLFPETSDDLVEEKNAFVNQILQCLDSQCTGYVYWEAFFEFVLAVRGARFVARFENMIERSTHITGKNSVVSNEEDLYSLWCRFDSDGDDSLSFSEIYGLLNYILYRVESKVECIQGDRSIKSNTSESDRKLIYGVDAQQMNMLDIVSLMNGNNTNANDNNIYDVCRDAKSNGTQFDNNPSPLEAFLSYVRITDKSCSGREDEGIKSKQIMTWSDFSLIFVPILREHRRFSVLH
eukprot:Tbor_TRINITY_DN4884_c1_g1::TRINITY_DN4884_c1_g1_i1::g.1349::m.1349